MWLRWWWPGGGEALNVRRWNLHVEASRQLAGARFATTADRGAVVGMVARAAELEIPTENTAKWRHEHRNDRWV